MRRLSQMGGWTLDPKKEKRKNTRDGLETKGIANKVVVKGTPTYPTNLMVYLLVVG